MGPSLPPPARRRAARSLARQFPNAEWFGQIVVRAGVECGYLVLFRTSRRWKVWRRKAIHARAAVIRWVLYALLSWPVGYNDINVTNRVP